MKFFIDTANVEDIRIPDRQRRQRFQGSHQRDHNDR